MDEKEFLSQIDQVSDLLSEIADSKLEDDVLVCECFCVSVLDIRQACESAQQVDFELLAKKLSLGQGCQSCLKTAKSWQDKIF